MMKHDNLVWKRTTLEEQEQDVMLYSKQLSQRERFVPAFRISKKAYPEICKEHKRYCRESPVAPILDIPVNS